MIVDSGWEVHENVLKILRVLCVLLFKITEVFEQKHAKVAK